VSDQQPETRRAARRSSGALTAFRRHPVAWLTAALSVVFVLLGTGAIFAGMAVAAPKPVVTPTPKVSTAPPRPTPTASPAASRVRTCSVAAAAADPRLVTLTGSVVRSDTGEALWDHGAGTPATTASTLKLLVASAAVAVLKPDYRIATDVVDGSAAGSIVLVGHGDPTLSALPAGQESVYTGAPKLSDLATQALTAYGAKHPGVPITQVILDASYWSTADRWTPDVKRTEQTQGYQSETTALQVDGDRANPKAETSYRSTDPIGRAGAAFVSALQNADTGGLVSGSVATSLGTAIPNSTRLAEVMSQPLRTLISQMLLPSDNTLGEMLARIVSKASGLDGSLASLNQAIPSALASAYKISTAGMTIVDGSGESYRSLVPPATMTSLLRQISSGTQGLDVVRAGLGVAGKSGSVASRFTGANAVARGQVAAKTGWTDIEYSLAGTIAAADGTPLVFTFYAIRPGIPSTAKAALDTLTTAVFRCGDNLSNN
jgi:D-alanyl-D-alanine carboxypeptidase/D-alanyl-D-alanine-endopeptidase (penicillin-binding protein 4)